jgi:Lon protease-like protein
MLEIPLFPLNTVLFPGMPLQLHIFEERYKQMLSFCQETNSPFGVVLIRQGVEALGPLATPYTIGCAAFIKSVKPLEEGRFAISAIGQERFKILGLSEKLPYLVGEVAEYPLESGNLKRIMQAEDRLRPWLEQYVRTLTRDEGIEAAIEQFPQDPVAFAYLAAVVLQISPSQKQPLLEYPLCEELLEELRVVYRREVALIKRIIQTQPADEQKLFSAN